MFDSKYLENLKIYVGKDVIIYDRGDEADFYDDWDIQYFLRRKGQKYILIIKERGCERDLTIYDSEIEMKRNIALIVKNIYSKNIDYSLSEEFEDATNTLELKRLISKYADESLYSVNDVKEDRINIQSEENNLYSIFFLDKRGNRCFFERDAEAPFAFARFYNEVVSYRESLKRLETYEKAFQDWLDYDDKIDLLYGSRLKCDN